MTDGAPNGSSQKRINCLRAAISCAHRNQGPHCCVDMVGPHRCRCPRLSSSPIRIAAVRYRIVVANRRRFACCPSSLLVSSSSVVGRRATKLIELALGVVKLRGEHCCCWRLLCETLCQSSRELPIRRGGLLLWNSGIEEWEII